MKFKEIIDERVHDYYWKEDLNCATTMLKTLAEIFEIKLESQIIDSAIGMHGAGKFGAQCGLVEGSLMFLGIFGRGKGVSQEIIISICYDFADNFQEEFRSLVCRELRPEGFKDDNPPHLCEDLTKRAVKFTVNYIMNNRDFTSN
ncbi:C_GCAxxG_C_C family probable redox protein [Anaerovirgula multivorans]|uniref:C_GCAxxG_C_C family probable redox protein n=1 Tax=Anaerovirgula multivorans TaxID=312168 RepID=A0A239F7M2_9FIRM|nr:C-GCAxxG-C-C family protein [Anaerovirgula multivorans]SNS52293.1 C_GCAxxG_C_C family probable redox protein [Anaerovirgula multivorans]